MDRGAFGFAVVANDVSEAGDHCFELGMREEVYFHLHTLADLVGLFRLHQHACDAQVEDLSRVPLRFRD